MTLAHSDPQATSQNPAMLNLPEQMDDDWVRHDATEKLRCLRVWLTQAGLAGVLLSRQDNFAWATSGGDSRVLNNSEAGFEHLLATPERQYLLAHSMDAARLFEEKEVPILSKLLLNIQNPFSIDPFLENSPYPNSKEKMEIPRLWWTMISLAGKEYKMPGSHPPYPAEFRQQMVELVRAGRTPQELADEFEPTAESIRNWVKQAERDEGQRSDGLTTDEKQELVRSGDRLDTTQVFEFVKVHQEQYPIATMCRVLEVSTSRYYAWLQRPPSKRAQEDQALTQQIE